MAQPKGSKTTKIKDLNPLFAMSSGSSELRFQEYKNLLMNAVQIIDKVSGNPIEFQIDRFIKDALIEENQIGYDMLTHNWALVYGVGVNELGDPLELNFVFRNGKTFHRNASYEINPVGAYLIRALPTSFSLAQLIKETTDFMANCDNAIQQNIDAVRTPYIVVSKDKNIQLSIEHALQQKQLGQACIVVSDDLGDSLKGINVAVPYIADKLDEISFKHQDRLLNKLGIMSANIDKKERVQVGEVNATVGQCTDYIYLLIDTFNKQMDTYGLPFEMKLNGSLEELYSNGVDSIEEQQPEEQEKEGEE